MQQMTSPAVVNDLADWKKADQWVDQQYVAKVYGKLYRGMLKVILWRLRKENPAVIHVSCIAALDDLIQTLDFGPERFMDEQHRLGPIGQGVADFLSKRQPYGKAA